MTPTWNKDLKMKQSDYLRECMEGSIAKHIIIWVKNSEIMNLATDSGEQGGKKGCKEKKHPFRVHFFGGCAAYADGCPASFDAGFEEDQLLMVAQRDYNTL